MAEFLLGWLLPWLVTVCLVVTFVSLAFNWRALVLSWQKIPKVVQACFLALVVVGFWIRWAGVPNQQRILFDEDRYLAYAVSFARFNQTVALDMATLEQHYLGKPDKAVRTTVPVINGWILKLAGPSELHLHWFAKVASVSQIIILFGLAKLVFRSNRIALVAAGLLTIFPVHVYWSSSIGLDSYFVLFSLLSVAATAWYFREPTTSRAVFLVVSTFLVMCVRVEAVVLLPLLAIMAVMIRREDGVARFHPTDRLLAGLAAPLVLFRLVIAVSIIGQKWCCAESLPLEAFSGMYLIRHVLLNLIALFRQSEIPLVLTFLALISMVTIQTWKNRWLCAWFWGYFVLYSTYYAGKFFSYEFSGSYGRFFLMLIPPMLMLVAVQLDLLYSWWLKQSGRVRGSSLVAGILVGLVVSLPTITQYRQLIATSPYFSIVEKGPHELRDFLLNTMLPQVPEQALVIHNLTAPVLLRDHPTIFFGTFLDNPRAIDLVVKTLESGIPVYSIEAPQCEVFPHRCQAIFARLEFGPVLPEASEAAALGYVEVKLKSASPSSIKR